MANKKAFTAAERQATEAISNTRRYSRMDSRALAGWGENVQPVRFQTYFRGRPPVNDCTKAGGTKAPVIDNMWKPASKTTAFKV